MIEQLAAGLLQALHVIDDMADDLIDAVLKLQVHDQLIDVAFQQAAFLVQLIQRVLQFLRGGVEVADDAFGQAL